MGSSDFYKDGIASQLAIIDGTWQQAMLMNKPKASPTNQAILPMNALRLTA